MQLPSQRWAWRAGIVRLAALALPAAAAVQGAAAFRREPFVAQTRHYRVATDIDQQAADTVALHMEAMFEHYTKCFASFKAVLGDVYNVRVYADRGSYVADVGERYERSAGVFSPAQRLVVLFKGAGSW